MSLIYFRGLNCYTASLLNAASFMGADYRSALENLWSEKNFTYDQLHHRYLSQRLPCNLEILGIKETFLNCRSVFETEKSLSELSDSQWFVVGMDAFFIPWTPYYRILHSSHYFIARQKNNDIFVCFDPTYNSENLEITREQMISHADDICALSRIPSKYSERSIVRESESILASHPQTREILLNQIKESVCKNQNSAGLLAQYTEALINNRYLYLWYLQNFAGFEKISEHCFPKEFFKKWAAVNHGLFKAHVRQKNNGNLIQQVSLLVTELIDEEQRTALKLIEWTSE